LFLEPLEDRTLMAAWAPIGPAPINTSQSIGANTAGKLPISGRVTGIAADPGNASIIYIATAGGGIWKSINSGSQWTPLTDTPTDSNGNPLTDISGNPLPEFMGAVAETDATSGPNNGKQIVYAGMGEANNGLSDSFYGEGILISTNGGTNWSLTTGPMTPANPKGAFYRNTVDKIVIDPNDKTGATAYAAVGSSSFVTTFTNGINGLSGNTGIWKTTNYGQTWTNMTGAAGLSTTDPWSDVVVDPIQQNGKTVLYAAEGNPYGSAGNGVYKSINGGQTWNLLAGAGAVNGVQDGRISLALFDGPSGGQNINELFVAISRPSFNGGLYKMLLLLNGGGTFHDLTNNPGLTNYLGNQGGYATTLAISPQDPNYIYVGGTQTNQGNPNYSGSPLESFDQGATWKDIATIAGNGPHSDDHAVAFNANGDLLDGNDGGVFKLTKPTPNFKQSWVSLNTNLQITQFVGIAAAVDPTTQNLIVYGGSQDNGTEKYTGSLGWNQIIGADGGITQVDPNQPNTVYMEQQNLALYASTDGGNPFIGLNDGIKGGAPKFYAPYVRDASGNLYYGTTQLNFWNNQSRTWTQIATPGSNGFNPGPGSLIHAIAVLNVVVNNMPKTVVYVSAGTGMWITQDALATDNGKPNATWTLIPLPNNNTIVPPVLDPVTPSATGGSIPAGTYYYEVTAVLPSGETTASNVQATTALTGSTNSVALSWSAITGATAYNVYRSTTAGSFTSPALITTAPAPPGGSKVTFTDTLATPTDGAPPISNTVAESLNSIAIDPSDTTGGTAYAVVNTFTGGRNHIYRTTDFGSTWNDITGNLPDTPVWSVLVNPTNSNDVYIGTDEGVYSTTDPTNGTFGAVWTQFGRGLPNAQVRELDYVPGKNILVVDTYGRGAWATALSPTPVVTTNPTNLTITYQQPAVFTAMALGTPLPTDVQWQQSTDGGNTWSNFATTSGLPATLNPQFFFEGPPPANISGIQYRAIFTNSAGSATTSAATLTITPGNAATRAANVPDVFRSSQQTVNLSATVGDASSPTDTVNEGTVTFTVENGSTVLGSVEGTVSGGTGNANFTLPAGLPIGNYTVAVSYADSLGNFTDDGDTSGTLTVAAAPTTTQLVQASLTPNLLNLTARETLTAQVSSSSPVTSGIVTFAVANQKLSANVDGNGNASVTLTVPLLNLLAPQVINVSYADPTQDLMASASTQTQVWQPLNLLAPSTATFGPNGEMVTMEDLFGFHLTFTNGLLTEIDFGSNQLVFSYNASNQLTQVTFDGLNLLA
jgi:hypothetical protein